MIILGDKTNPRKMLIEMRVGNTIKYSHKEIPRKKLKELVKNLQLMTECKYKVSSRQGITGYTLITRLK